MVSRLVAAIASIERLLVGAAGAGDAVEAHLEQGVDEPDELRPLLAGRLRVLVGQRLCVDSRQRAGEGVGGGPPHLGRETVAAVAERLDGRREQHRLGHRDDLGVEVLLLGLGPERAEVGWDRDAAHDLDALVLELADDAREVGVAGLEPTRVDEREAAGVDAGREAGRRIGEGVAVGVVGAQQPDDLVGLDRVPHVDEHPDELLGAPEEVVGPVEPGRRIATATEEVRLPRRQRRQARHAVGLALVGDGVDHLRRRDRDHHVDAVLEDQRAGLRRRGVGVRLDVLDDELDRVRLVAEHDAVGDQGLDAGHDELVGLAEARRVGR